MYPGCIQEFIQESIGVVNSKWFPPEHTRLCQVFLALDAQGLSALDLAKESQHDCWSHLEPTCDPLNNVYIYVYIPSGNLT